jgi:hypothetical protein
MVSGLLFALAISVPTHTAEVELEEVEVVGKRLDQLRRDITAAEDNFFETFNELNKDDKFDIHCSYQAPTGTQIKRRQCLPEFIIRAQHDDARAFLEGRSTQSSLPRVAAQYEKAYRATVRAALEKHAKLRQFAGEQQKLEAQYRRLHAARFKKREQDQ